MNIRTRYLLGAVFLGSVIVLSQLRFSEDEQRAAIAQSEHNTEAHPRPIYSSDERSTANDPELPQEVVAKGAADQEISKGWGELVRFKFDTDGCNTETVGANAQIPCEPKVVADHPYEFLSDDQLRQISHTDGIAALILGTRLGYRRANVEEYRESLESLTTAVALTGHVDALNMLMTQYGFSEAPLISNGQLDVGKATQSYVWHKTGHDLGLISEEVLERASRPLRDHGGIDFSALDEIAEQRTQWFQMRRMELTGRTFS